MRRAGLAGRNVMGKFSIVLTAKDLESIQTRSYLASLVCGPYMGPFLCPEHRADTPSRRSIVANQDSSCPAIRNIVARVQGGSQYSSTLDLIELAPQPHTSADSTMAPPTGKPAAVPASGVKALSVGDVGSIITESGDVLTISGTGIVMLNGSEIPGGDGAAAVAHDYGTKLTYVQGDGTHNWFVWSQATSWVSSAAPPQTGAAPASKPATVAGSLVKTAIAKPGQSLRDASGADWMLVASPTKGMQLARDGSIMAATANVLTSYIHEGRLHYTDTNHDVRVWDGRGWTMMVADPVDTTETA